jgi:hypothetical protein
MTVEDPLQSLEVSPRQDVTGSVPFDPVLGPSDGGAASIGTRQTNTSLGSSRTY